MQANIPQAREVLGAGMQNNLIAAKNVVQSYKERMRDVWSWSFKSNWINKMKTAILAFDLN